MLSAPMSRLSATCGRIAGSTAFDVVIFAVIVANAVVLGLETYDELRSDIGGLLTR
jgi:voltage-gated sodium channel